MPSGEFVCLFLNVAPPLLPYMSTSESTPLDLSTFGSPQAIARKGRYGAFLLEEPETVVALVDALARSIAVPVTAKVRGRLP